MQKFVKKTAAYVVVALSVLLVTPAVTPPATAAPVTDIWTHYYTCDMVLNGWKFRGCDSTGGNWGTLSGYYKEIESCSCQGSTCTITWYQWNGTTWINIGSNEPPHAC